MVPRGWPTVCYSCGSENSNSKSSKLLLSWGYYHMCAISIDWQLPLDQLGTIDLAALHFKLIVLEMRSTLPGIPLFERWIFIFIWQDVDITDIGYISYLVHVYPAEAVSLATIGQRVKRWWRAEGVSRSHLIVCFVECWLGRNKVGSSHTDQWKERDVMTQCCWWETKLEISRKFWEC